MQMPNTSESVDRYNVEVDCVLLHRAATRNQLFSFGAAGDAPKSMLGAGHLRSPPLSPLRYEDHGTTAQVGGAPSSREEDNLFAHGAPLEGTQPQAKLALTLDPGEPSPWTVGIGNAPSHWQRRTIARNGARVGLGSTIHRRDPLVIGAPKSAEGPGLARIDRESSHHADTSIRIALRSKCGSCRPLDQHSKWMSNKLSRSDNRLHRELAIKI
jgi:hypothetical protein